MKISQNIIDLQYRNLLILVCRMNFHAMFGNLLILRLRVDTGLVLLEMVARWYRQLFRNVFNFSIDGLTMWWSIEDVKDIVRLILSYIINC